MKLILIAGALALFLSLFGTPALIKALARRGYGQIIRDDGPSTHHTKRGTPTMGGLIIIFASLVAYLAAHAVTQSAISTSAVLILGLVISLGFVGFLDDYMKISRQNSRGISGKQKILGQVLFASIFGYLGTRFPDRMGSLPSRSISQLFAIQVSLLA
jgi:phospho-N-acetylmuramoyl-pentapeptide-transferase